jgi:phosphoglycerate dehydrogenase-like enzyme
MKIAVLHPESPYATAEFERLTAPLSDHELVTWHPGESPPANDFQILLGIGEIDRKLLESQPHLELVQTTTAGYEGVDVEAATTLGIWVSFAPSGETGNAISVAEWAVLLLMASSRDLGLALQSERDLASNQSALRRRSSAKTSASSASAGSVASSSGGSARSACASPSSTTIRSARQGTPEPTRPLISSSR